MRAPVLSLLLLLPLVLAVPAHAGDPCARLTENTHASVGGSFYVEVRSNGDAWLYQETNGILQLQRGGTNVLAQTDGCVDDVHVTPDRAIL